MYIPSANEIESLHRKHAPYDELFEAVFEHCQIVASIALVFAKQAKTDANIELMQAGALLHDIGVYGLFRADETRVDIPYITHGYAGYKVLKSEGFDEAICRFAARHTGTGLSKQEIEANGFPLPAHDFFADSIEEEIVMYADKFHSKIDESCFNTLDFARKNLSKFGAERVAKLNEFVQKYGFPDLAMLSVKYGHRIRDADELR